MAYRRIQLATVLALLTRAGQGQRSTEIAATLSLGAGTVRRYIRVARALGWDGLTSPSIDLAADTSATMRRRARVTEDVLEVWEQSIRGWLAERPAVPLTRIHEMLVSRGVAVSYSSVWRFAVRHCGMGRDERMRAFERRASVVGGEGAL